MCRNGIKLAAVLLIMSAGSTNVQQTRAGVLTCDVSAGLGVILGSRKEVSCAFAPTRPGRRENYGGVITKFGARPWRHWRRCDGFGAVHQDRGPGFLAGDYVGVSGEASVGAGLGANVLVGGSIRAITLQPLSGAGPNRS
jgi:hypothetical protein